MAEVSRREARKSAQINRIQLREKERTLIKQVRKVLKKKIRDRSIEDTKLLEEYPEAVVQVTSSISKQTQLKERLLEVEDPIEELETKCRILAKAIKEAKFVVVYTGAGISTAARIPDYRGPSGIWTLLKKGQDIGVQDLSMATPTFSHMALLELHNKNIVRHIVSQNCDGLHLRSGLSQKSLSEVHGNMYIEVCTSCKPLCQYVRLFDVTEKTALHRHRTGRRCHRCRQELRDSIVHFGERGKLRWPLNWEGAARAAKKADLILCLGTSLKVLKRYPCLWFSEGDKADLYVVNLQWTPKDEQATLKINGKCDQVMQKVMELLQIPVQPYSRDKDPIFELASPLKDREEQTATTNRLTLIDIESSEFSCQSFVPARNQPLVEKMVDLNCETSETDEESGNELNNKLNKEVSQENSEDNEKKAKGTGGGWYGKGITKPRKSKLKK